MMSIFRPIVDRVKSMFAVSAAQELEADFLLRDAERRADLFRQADRYEAQGLRAIAQHLRQCSETVSLQTPLAGVLPALAHLGCDPDPQQSSLPALPISKSPPEHHHSLSTNRKKGGKH